MNWTDEQRKRGRSTTRREDKVRLEILRLHLTSNRETSARHLVNPLSANINHQTKPTMTNENHCDASDAHIGEIEIETRLMMADIDSSFHSECICHASSHPWHVQMRAVGFPYLHLRTCG